MDKSISKILTKLYYYVPISKRKGLSIYPINPQIFMFLPYVHFLKDFQRKTFRDFLCFQIALTQSIFELERCSFFLNRSQFCHNRLIQSSVTKWRQNVIYGGTFDEKLFLTYVHMLAHSALHTTHFTLHIIQQSTTQHH